MRNWTAATWWKIWQGASLATTISVFIGLISGAVWATGDDRAALIMLGSLVMALLCWLACQYVGELYMQASAQETRATMPESW